MDAEEAAKKFAEEKLKERWYNRDDGDHDIATKYAELEAQVEKLRGVLVCVNNNCERRDKKIAKLEAENEQLRQALDNLYSVIDKRKMYIIKDSITNELNEAQAVLETAKGKVSDDNPILLRSLRNEQLC